MYFEIGSTPKILHETFMKKKNKVSPYSVEPNDHLLFYSMVEPTYFLFFLTVPLSANMG